MCQRKELEKKIVEKEKRKEKCIEKKEKVLKRSENELSVLIVEERVKICEIWP